MRVKNAENQKLIKANVNAKITIVNFLLNARLNVKEIGFHFVHVEVNFLFIRRY